MNCTAGSPKRCGTIAAYVWDFGNGANSNAANPSYTYTSPGTYIASLVVIDNGGLSGSTTVNVTVNNCIFVSSIAISANKNATGSQATAVVTVKDLKGNAIPGAKVSGAWSGLVSSKATPVTDANGKATFVSNRVNKLGTFIFKVTSLSLSGGYYNSAANVLSQTFIVTP